MDEKWRRGRKLGIEYGERYGDWNCDFCGDEVGRKYKSIGGTQGNIYHPECYGKHLVKTKAPKKEREAFEYFMDKFFYLETFTNQNKIDFWRERSGGFIVVSGGKVTYLSLNWKHLEQIPKETKDLTNLQKLSLRDNYIKKIENLEGLTNLRHLDLYSNKITEIENLDELINLKYLHLSDNRLKEIKGLENLKNLEYLSISSNEITEIKGLENLVNLKELYLCFNKITEVKGLENLVNLEELRLDSNKTLKIEKPEIKLIKSLPKLKRLNVNREHEKKFKKLYKNYVKSCRSTSS